MITNSMIEKLKLNDFFSKNHKIFALEIDNDFCGFEKWLQFELANHLLSNKLFDGEFKIRLEKPYQRDGKMTEKKKNFVDLSITERNKTKTSTDIELKISSKPSTAIWGLIEDLGGIRQITKTSWNQRAIVGIAVYLNNYTRTTKYKRFIDNIKDGRSKLFSINEIKNTNYEYIVSAWNSPTVKDKAISRCDYIRYYDLLKQEFDNLFYL